MERTGVLFMEGRDALLFHEGFKGLLHQQEIRMLVCIDAQVFDEHSPRRVTHSSVSLGCIFHVRQRVRIVARAQTIDAGKADVLHAIGELGWMFLQLFQNVRGKARTGSSP